ncbi:MAG: class I SAM-dependent methyltransferase [Saprospiraceae bacterium]|nr:class I SAM-dependent methyltransferase [Saprospiraceae bacterium]
MTYFLIALGLLLLAYLVVRLVKRSKFKSLHPFMPAEYNFGKRRDTFQKSLDLLMERHAKVLVETGTARGGLVRTKSDGASTVVFGKWAKENGAEFHSVDIDAAAIAEAQQSVDAEKLTQSVSLHVSDSIEFLAQFPKKIDFLYLDSYDYSKHDLTIQQLSQEHHLKEFKAVEDKLHDQSFVLIDDCKLPNGGKGKLVIDYMLQNGWKIIMDHYQVLLTK